MILRLFTCLTCLYVHCYSFKSFSIRHFSKESTNTISKRNSAFALFSFDDKSQLSYRSPISSVDQTRSETLQTITRSLVLWAGIASNRPAKAADISNEKICSDSVSFLEGPYSKASKVLLIGTAHISEDSALLVRKAVSKIKPDVVMIELDPKRIGRTGSKSLQEAGFDVPEGTIIAENRGAMSPEKTNAFTSLLRFAQTMASAAAGAVLGQALSSFYKSIEKLGFTPGAEFAAAVESGLANGARILLGDRDVDLTLQRVSQAIEKTDLNSFVALGDKLESLVDEEGGSSVLSGDFPTDKASMTTLVEGMKQRGYLTAVMAEVRTSLPEVYSALIAERDAFMAESIRGANGVTVVAVVGMAHMDGIERNLRDKGYKISTNHCI